MSEARTVGVILDEILGELRRFNDNAESDRRKDDVLYTVAEASAYLNRSRQTLNSYKKRGLIHKVVRAGRTGYLKSELDKTVAL